MPLSWGEGSSGGALRRDDRSAQRAPLPFRLYSGQRLAVWNGGSDATIFDDPEINFAFRAWHDAHHLLLNAPFSPEGEAEVARAMQRDIDALFGPEDDIGQRYKALIDAEVMGQLAYSLHHGGAFPDNQRAFDEAWLANPKAALKPSAYPLPM